jgi:hypothetical protein
MTAVYDSIAQQYQKTLKQPSRQYVEAHTYFHVLGDLSNKSILDLACGGYSMHTNNHKFKSG